MIAEFLTEAREYAARRGIRLVTLGVYAANDSRLFPRLDRGGQCLPRTMDKIRQFMRDNPPDDDSALNPTSEPQHDPASSDPA